MKRLFSLTLTATFLLLALGCTDNQRARTFGGTIEIKLPPGQKLLNATWKQDDMWYLTRPMRTNEVPEACTFRENSSFGIVEGKVIFREQK